MAILPTTNHQSHYARPPSNLMSSLPIMFKRLTRFPSQMPDFELATWQLLNLCIAPRKVYRQVYYHKQTKNTWARDDPAVLILICGGLLVAGLAWGIVKAHGPAEILSTVAIMLLRDFFLVGILSSTALWAIANRALAAPSTIHTTEQRAEWAYAFDVHCNGFFPILLILYFAQLFLAPVITKHNWICLFAGNTLYLAAFAQYWYITYLGYNALPFLVRSELLLFPVVLLFCLYIVSLLGFNVARHVLSTYFG